SRPGHLAPSYPDLDPDGALRLSWWQRLSSIQEIWSTARCGAYTLLLVVLRDIRGRILVPSFHMKKRYRDISKAPTRTCYKGLDPGPGMSQLPPPSDDITDGTPNLWIAGDPILVNSDHWRCLGSRDLRFLEPARDYA
ncbi:Hypothetical predicted protein, partial [Pelobates cultripes]